MSRAAASNAALHRAPQPPSQGACPVCGDAAAAEPTSAAAPSDAAGGGKGGGVGGACSSAAGDGAGSGAGASDGGAASCEAPAAGSYGAGGAGGGDGGSASAASMRSCSARVTAARASLWPPHGAAPRDAAASVRRSCAPLTPQRPCTQHTQHMHAPAACSRVRRLRRRLSSERTLRARSAPCAGSTTAASAPGGAC